MYVERELSLVSTFCHPDLDVIDAGACKGVYTRAAAPQSHMVFAFEPVQQLYNALIKRRFVHNKNVVVYPYALSDSNGQRILYIPWFLSRFHTPYALHAMASIVQSYDTYFASNTKGYLKEEKTHVDARTLDSFNLQRVGFIKIDVEGSEEAVLHGAVATIALSHPHILVEIAERRNSGGLQRVSAWLGRQGYLGFFIYNNRLVPIEKFDIQAMQIQPLEHMKKRLSTNIPGYMNNFIFIHKDKIDMLDVLQHQIALQLC